MKRRSLEQIFAEEDSLPATYNTELASYLEKYDGYRAIWDGEKFLSRNNKPLVVPPSGASNGI